MVGPAPFLALPRLRVAAATAQPRDSREHSIASLCVSRKLVCVSHHLLDRSHADAQYTTARAFPLFWGCPRRRWALRLALPRAQLPSAPPPPGLHSPRTLLALRWSSGRSSVGPAPVFWGGFPVSGLPALLLVGLLPFATPFGSPLLWWALSPCAGGGPRSLVHPSQLAPPSGPSLAFGCFWVLPGPSGLPPSPRPRSPLPSGFVGPRWSSGRSLVGPAARVLGRLSGLWPARPPSVWAPPLSHSLWVPLAFVGPPPLCGWWSPFAGSPLPAGSSKCD